MQDEERYDDAYADEPARDEEFYQSLEEPNELSEEEAATATPADESADMPSEAAHEDAGEPSFRERLEDVKDRFSGGDSPSEEESDV